MDLWLNQDYVISQVLQVNTIYNDQIDTEQYLKILSLCYESICIEYFCSRKKDIYPFCQFKFVLIMLIFVKTYLWWVYV